MPAVLAHKSVALLARERIREVVVALENKARRGGAMSDLERRVLHLAQKALDLSNRPAPAADAFSAPGGTYFPPLGAGISKFVVMGTMAPDIAAFSAVFARNQAWVFDTIHKGSPDANREAVAAGTADFAIEVWRQFAQRNTEEAQREKVRAFVLGHLAHIATDVLAHPYVNALEWKAATSDFAKFSHEGTEAAIEAAVARTVLLRESTRAGQDWSKWWPGVDEPPRELFDAMAAAFEAIYAGTRLPPGLPDYERALTSSGGAVTLSSNFFRDGWSFLRKGVVGIVYDFSYWGWFGPLTFVVAPALLMPFATAGFNASGSLYKAQGAAVDHGEWPWFSFLSTCAFLVAPISLGSLIWITSLSNEGVSGYTTAALVLSSFSLVFSFAAFVTGVADESRATPWWVRWLLLLGPVLGIYLGFTVAGVVQLSTGQKRLGGLTMVAFGVPLFLMALFLLYFAALHGLAARQGTQAGLDTASFWIWFGVWLCVCVGLGYFLLAHFLHTAVLTEDPNPNVTTKRHRIRAFDDSTLYALPRPNAPAEVVLHYPSGRRKLLHLWWTGAGDCFVRPQRHGIELSFTGGDSDAPAQVITGPVQPMRLSEYAAFLEKTARDSGGATGKLRARIAHADDPDVVLPPGAAFSDHGDSEDNRAAHDAKAQKYQKLGTTEDLGGGYALWHAPKSANAVFVGAQGPVAVDPAPGGDGNDPDGYRFVHEPNEGITSDTIMGRAADLTALLWMGAVPHLLDGGQLDVPGVAAPTRLEKVHQVLRNWNLDRRRVNEWRTLVLGNASTEAPGQPGRWHEGLLRHATPNTYVSPAPLGEATANELGWTRLLRDWLQMARDPGFNATDATPAWEGGPERRALSRAMAFLLDLPQP
jgi:hypothetical protein